MTRIASLTGITLMAVGFTLTTPGTSRAQSGFGIHLDTGRTHLDFSYGGYPRAVYPAAPVIVAPYDAYRRPVVVAPDYYRYRDHYPHHGHRHHDHRHGHYGHGHHGHGHGPVLVPHRDHYHVRPY